MACSAAAASFVVVAFCAGSVEKCGQTCDATEVHVTLTQDSDMITLVVADNGLGF